MFFNIPKIKIIDNLFIVSCLLLKHFDKKEQEKWAWEMFFSTFTMLSPLRCI